jgi:hypothetical protein
VRVCESGNDVHVNVPLAMALAALPDAKGRISTAALAGSLWRARFTDLVEVHDGKEHVTISVW